MRECVSVCLCMCVCMSGRGKMTKCVFSKVVYTRGGSESADDEAVE